MAVFISLVPVELVLVDGLGPSLDFSILQSEIGGWSGFADKRK